MHFVMDDLRNRNRTGEKDDDGGYTVLPVVPFRDKDAVFLKVAGDAEEDDEDDEDRQTRLRGSFRLLKEGDGGITGMSQKNSRRWTDCLCFEKGHEPEVDTEVSRAAVQRGKLILSELSLGSSALLKLH